MINRQLLWLLCLVLVVGCSRWTRDQSQPAQRQTPPPPMVNPSPATGQGTTPYPPSSVRGTSPPDSAMTPVPPRPPADSYVLAQPPASPAGSVVPAGGFVPPGPGVRPASGDQARINVPGVPAVPTAAELNTANLRRIANLACKKWDTVDDYEARLVRRETVNGVKGPTEELLYQYRKSPMSIYMRNTSEAGKDRQVLFVAGRNDDKMKVSTGKGDAFVVGMKVDISPDSPLALSKSRYNLRDTGFGKGIHDLAALLVKIEEKTAMPDALTYLGKVQRPEWPYPLEAVAWKIRVGDEKHSPKGGTRIRFYDTKPDSPTCGLPVLVVAYGTDMNDELEYYAFDRFRIPAGLTDADFSPERMNKKK